jgi:hypothetical protein
MMVSWSNKNENYLKGAGTGAGFMVSLEEFE